jgi:hypothetical protein
MIAGPQRLPARRVLILGMVAAFAFSCHKGEESPDRTTREGQVTNADRIAAMLSIHAYARWPDRKFPQRVEVIELEQAVEILKRDRDRLAPSRRRRAVAKLAAYALGNARIDHAIDDLGAKAQGLNRRRFGLVPQPGVAFAALVDDVADRESALADLVAEEYDGFEVNDCKWTKFYQHVYISGQTIGFDTSINVERDLPSVSRTIDPQKWDETSKFFEPPTPPKGTFLAKKGSGDVPIEKPALPAGEPFSTPQLLFERFVCAVTGCGTIFENYLTTDTVLTNSKDKYVVAYWLDQTYSGERVKVDQGEITADSTLMVGQIKVLSHKSIQFDNPTLNGIAVAALQQSELAGELAEMVCHNVPPETS